ncbi:MAG TPA: pitrilysin family protein [Longimicrobiales bacterium]
MRANIAYVAAMSIPELLRSYEASTRTLENGLTVVVREDHSAEVAAIVTYVNAGYFDESDQWVGISHVLEHMYFKGTPSRGPGVIAQQTKAAGGYLNASTIYDHTSYYAVVPASTFEEGLDIQADALLNSLIDEQELAKELEVIVQEAKRKLDNPAAVARESVYELLFDQHRMRRWRIGTEAGLRKLTRQDVYDFFTGWYRGSSIVLVVAGAIEAEAAFEAVRRRYQHMRPGAVERDRGPAEPERADFRWRELTGDVQQTRVEIGWRTQPTMHPDTPALDLLAVILGQGRAARLYRAVRDTGLASGVSAHNYTPTEVGVFGVSAEVQPADTRAALRAIFDTVSTAHRGIAAEEVARAQSIVEARMLRSLETMEGQANFLAEWQSAGDWRFGFDYLDRLLSLRPAQIEQVARKYLTAERAAVIAYRPQNASAIAASAEEVQRWLAA